MMCPTFLCLPLLLTTPCTDHKLRFIYRQIKELLRFDCGLGDVQGQHPADPVLRGGAGHRLQV